MTPIWKTVHYWSTKSPLATSHPPYRTSFVERVGRFRRTPARFMYENMYREIPVFQVILALWNRRLLFGCTSRRTFRSALIALLHRQVEFFVIFVSPTGNAARFGVCPNGAPRFLHVKTVAEPTSTRARGNLGKIQAYFIFGDRGDIQK